MTCLRAHEGHGRTASFVIFPLEQAFSLNTLQGETPRFKCKPAWEPVLEGGDVNRRVGSAVPSGPCSAGAGPKVSSSSAMLPVCCWADPTRHPCTVSVHALPHHLLCSSHPMFSLPAGTGALF